MTPEEHAHVLDLIPAYALGSVDADEVSDVARHIEDCPSCRAELESFRAVVDAMAFAAPSSVPSPAVRRRLLAEINVRPEPTVAPKQAPARRFPAFSLPVAFALVGIAVVIFGVVWLAAGRQTAAQLITLSPSEDAPGASGELEVDRNGREATLTVWNLPLLPPEQQYQLWLVADEERDSGAVFSVNENGWAAVPVEVQRDLDEYDRFGITIEPTGGSPGPTGSRVLESG